MILVRRPHFKVKVFAPLFSKSGWGGTAKKRERTKGAAFPEGKCAECEGEALKVLFLKTARFCAILPAGIILLTIIIASDGEGKVKMNWLHIILTWVVPIMIIRVLGNALRRFEIGSDMISVLTKWWVLLFMIGIISDIVGVSYLSYLNRAAFMFFLTLSIFAGLQALTWQMIGIIAPYFRYKFKLPSKENYILKGNYILPFSGKWIVVNGGVTKNLSHSWFLPSQRYAYDFIIVDDDGKSASGDRRSLSSYYCYGKDIIAPADGKVVSLYDKYKNSFVDGKNAFCDSSNIAGNYIVIKHNDSEYSAIAHLVPGSLVVKKGDIVKQGQVIAKCGNSGNSSEPHIHFQLQSGKSFFMSAGLPIAFTDVKAQENHSFIDNRPRKDNLQVEGNKSYIARGLEVENTVLK